MSAGHKNWEAYIADHSDSELTESSPLGGCAIELLRSAETASDLAETMSSSSSFHSRPGLAADRGQSDRWYHNGACKTKSTLIWQISERIVPWRTL